MVKGTYPKTMNFNITSSVFTDPFKDRESVTVQDYLKELIPHIGVIEYVDPYESNEAYIAMYPEQVVRESTHVEIHPSTMVGLLTSMIPFPNHNQSPRNQLSCSQSKQGISIYSTNYKNRFDNQTHVLCYGEAPLVRTSYYDYVADGQIGYGHNIILAIGAFTGYNQEDGIVFNADSFQRGMFRNMTFRSYEAFEEDDDKAGSKTRIANPENIPSWLSLKPGLDYRKLDERGIIKKGERVDETTVLVGRYIQTGMTQFKDDSVTAQVWTSGIVEDVSLTINNKGLALVKIRVIQDRVPELGDKFSNRHGQKGTAGMLVRAHDMPRTANGLVPDMIMNPHAIPSRMTIAQLLESLLGKAACLAGFIGDGTAFMNEAGIESSIGSVLQDQFNLHKYGEELMYDGTNGSMIPTTIFTGNVYTMRLKHMVEDKWNARGEGRREQKTRQPTGGRGNQGGLRIGEMERDSLVAHGISSFIRETYTKRADGYSFIVCNGCGTVPITNIKDNFKICSLCDGPLQFIGETANNLELLPTMKRSITTFSKIELPFSFELLNKEMNTYMNMYLRYLTTKDITHIRKTKFRGLKEEEIEELLNTELPERILKDLVEPEMVKEEESITITPEEEAMLGKEIQEEDEEDEEDLPELEVNQGVNKADLLEGQTVMVSQPPIAMMVPQAPVEMVLQPTITTPLQATQPTITTPLQPTITTPLQEQQQGGSNQQYMLMPVTPTIQPMQIVQAQIPNAPPTLVVDTSPQAMEAGGFSNNELPTIRSILKGGSSRSTSPSSSSKNTTFSVSKLGSDSSSSTSSSSNNTRINIVKEGQ